MSIRCGLCWIVACVALARMAYADDWPRFRGPDGAGTASAPNLPVEWDLDDYAWKTELDGLGHSSPVVRDGRLFVTSATPEGASRRLHCLDADTGDILWTRELSLSKDTMHLKSSYASSTPVVSEESVITTFADNDHHMVAAFRLDGTPRWKKDLGEFEGEHGHGASPIVWQGKVFVPNDQDAKSSYVALDEASGDILWKVERESGVASYSTPLILELADQPPQLVTSSNGEGVVSLDPETGKTLWSTGPLPQRTVSSPIMGDDLLFQACGVGGRGRLLVGVDPTLKSNLESRIVFEAEKQIPYVPTPIFHDGHLFLWGDNGVVACFKPTSAEPVWIDRVGGNFSSSPVCVNGCLYNVSEDGEVAVIRAAPKFEILGRSPLGERSQATAAVANGKMFFHTEHHVLCLAPKSNS